MVPLVPDPLPALGGVPVQINAGVADPIVTPEQSEALGALLQRAGASVSLDWVQAGHNLSPRDLEIGGQFLARISAAA
jgi:phospholipase/carboxylesterase